MPKSVVRIANIVIVIALVIAGIYDLAVFGFGGSGQTISYQFWVLSKQYPVVPWLLGVINGHLVWQYGVDDINNK